jgi:hypothetical protein
MRRGRCIVRNVRGESGVVLVLFAMMLPALIGMGGLVIDVGNWFAHKRHLQTQADAAALAGAGEFRFPCSDTPIREEIAQYSSVDQDGYNPQIGSTELAELHEEINSPTWYEQSAPVDDTVRTGGPCAAKMIDVKLTETDLPWYLKLFGDLVPYINTHARVEIRQQTVSAGALPVGVPDTGPQRVRAIFVDEATGNVVASRDLTATGTSSGGLAIWSNADVPVPVTVNSARIGVRIVLSGTDSVQCGDPLVNCYGAGSNTAIVANTPGLTHIRGWSSTPAGTATAPQIRDAVLLAGSCTEDAYFTATSTAYPCSLGIRATIDGVASSTPVFAKRATGSNTKVPLTYSDGVWSAPSGIPVAAGEGPVNIQLFYGTGNGTLIGTAQRTFAGGESLTSSGPIKMLRLSENGVAGANSFERCATCTRNLVVTLGLKPSLQNADSVGDPVVSLKVAGGGSQNQGLDCDPDRPNIRDELAYGCGPSYRENDGQACPTANVLWNSTPQPWNCVVINTGATVGQVTQGMNIRILGAADAACTAPNNWSMFEDPGLPAGDPRIVQVFLTPFGAFSGSGGTTVPVTGFATFYVTGWHNGGCQGSGDDPAGQGEIVGHFIKYVDTLNNGDAGEEMCDENALGSCVAVFTR